MASAMNHTATGQSTLSVRTYFLSSFFFGGRDLGCELKAACPMAVTNAIPALTTLGLGLKKERRRGIGRIGGLGGRGIRVCRLLLFSTVKRLGWRRKGLYPNWLNRGCRGVRYGSFRG